MLILFLSLLVVPLFQTLAAKNPVDSLRDLIAQEKDEAKRIKHYVLICNEFSKINQYDSAVHYAEIEEKLAAEIGKDSLVAGAIFRKFQYARYDNRNTEAKKYYRELQNLWPKIIYKGNRIRVFTLYAGICIDEGNFYNGLIAANKAIELARTYHLPTHEAEALYLAGQIYGYKGDGKKTIQLYEQALLLNEKDENLAIRAFILCGLGDIYYNSKNYQKALECQQKALNQFLKDNNNEMAAAVLPGLAMALYGTGKKMEAKKMAEQAINKAHEFKLNNNLITMFRIVAEWEMEAKNFGSALVYSDSALKYSSFPETRKEKVVIVKQHSKILKALGRYREAMDVLEIQTALHDSIFTEQGNSVVKEWETKLETREKENANVQLKNRLDLEEQKIRILILLLVVAALTLVIVRMAWVNRTRKMAQEKKYLEQIQKTTELALNNETLKLQALRAEQELEKEKTKQIELELDFKNKELVSVTAWSVRKSEILHELSQAIPTVTGVSTDLKEIASTITNSLDVEAEWEAFKLHFDQVHPDFFNNLLQRAPNLTPNDLRVAAYVKMNLSTKQISQVMNIAMQSVHNARHRIRTKLHIENLDELLKDF